MNTPVMVKGVITENVKVARGIHKITISGNFPVFKPGQFCMVEVPCDGTICKKPYSIASAPWEKNVSFCIKQVPDGKVSTTITQLPIHTPLSVHIPFGTFTLVEEEVSHLLIATGTGYAPMRSILRTLFKNYFSGEGENTTQQVTLLFGTTNQEEIIFFDELNTLAKEVDNFHYYVTLTGEKVSGLLEGRVQEHLDKVLTKDAHIYICGVRAMMLAVKEELLKKNVSKNTIHVEGFI